MFGGEIDAEYGAACKFTFDLDTATALLNDAVNGGEAEAGAFAHRLGGEKRFEDVGESCGIHAMAGIGDFEHGVMSGSNIQIAALLGGELEIGSFHGQPTALGHGVTGVDGKVHQNLFHLARVGLHRHERGVNAGDPLNVLTNHPGQHFLYIADRFIQVEHCRLQDLFAAEGEQLLSERGGAIGSALDLLDAVAGLVVETRGSQQQLAMSHDDAEDVVEVVGDTARQAPDGFHLLSVSELGFQLDALGNISSNAPGANPMALDHNAGHGVAEDFALAPGVKLA